MRKPVKVQRSKKARDIRKESTAAGLYPGLHHPSHVSGVARFIRLYRHKSYTVKPDQRAIEWRFELR